MKLPKSVADLIELEKLPGIGPKSAERLTYHVLNAPKEYSARLSEVIGELKEKATLCRTYFNIAETNLCDVCSARGRDSPMVIVV